MESWDTAYLVPKVEGNLAGPDEYTCNPPSPAWSWASGFTQWSLGVALHGTWSLPEARGLCHVNPIPSTKSMVGERITGAHTPCGHPISELLGIKVPGLRCPDIWFTESPACQLKPGSCYHLQPWPQLHIIKQCSTHHVANVWNRNLGPLLGACPVPTPLVPLTPAPDHRKDPTDSSRADSGPLAAGLPWSCSVPVTSLSSHLHTM